jgi:hypothetical protein
MVNDVIVQNGRLHLDAIDFVWFDRRIYMVGLDLTDRDGAAKFYSLSVRRRAVSPACIAGVRSELQSPVWPNEVVVATQQLKVLTERLFRSRVGKRSSRKVCQALPDGQIQALDE